MFSCTKEPPPRCNTHTPRDICGQDQAGLSAVQHQEDVSVFLLNGRDAAAGAEGRGGASDGVQTSQNQGGAESVERPPISDKT